MTTVARQRISLRMASTAIATMVSGCASLAVVNGPTHHSSPTYEESAAICTVDKGWVVFDGVLAVLYASSAVAVVVKPEEWEDATNLNATGSAIVYGAVSVLAITSAAVGNRRVSECRSARVASVKKAQERMEAIQSMEQAGARTEHREE